MYMSLIHAVPWGIASEWSWRSNGAFVAGCLGWEWSAGYDLEPKENGKIFGWEIFRYWPSFTCMLEHYHHYFNYIQLLFPTRGDTMTCLNMITQHGSFSAWLALGSQTAGNGKPTVVGRQLRFEYGGIYSYGLTGIYRKGLVDPCGKIPNVPHI